MFRFGCSKRFEIIITIYVGVGTAILQRFVSYSLGLDSRRHYRLGRQHCITLTKRHERQGAHVDLHGIYMNKDSNLLETRKETQVPRRRICA